MKKVLAICILLITYQSLTSQNMTPTKMGKLFEKVADSIQGNGSQWQFKIKEVFFMCVTDSLHNRMRIISPITNKESLDKELKEAALIANFHTALDVKYAISDNILWSAYIHPLKELTEEQVMDAISQVYYANINFGTTFSSTSLIFPGNKPKKIEQKKKVIRKI